MIVSIESQNGMLHFLHYSIILSTSALQSYNGIVFAKEEHFLEGMYANGIAQDQGLSILSLCSCNAVNPMLSSNIWT